MILPTNIEPANRGTAFGIVPNGIRSSWMEATVESPKIGQRWLAVVGSKDTASQCLSFVRRFAKGDAEIHLAKPSGSDSASEVRQLAIALEVDWLCMVAQRGTGVMSLFLRSDVERILRAAPCPTFCIPETFSTTGEHQSANQDAIPIRRVLAPINLSLPSRRQVENAVAVAERFGTKLDLLGVQEHLRNPDVLRSVSHREAKRLQIQAVKKELSNLADELIPNRMRGRILANVGFPLFYATTCMARELNSALVVLAVPTRLWINQGRIDASTERILHRVGCPVICIPELTCELSGSRPPVLNQVRRHHWRRDRRTLLYSSSRYGHGPFPERKDFRATRHQCAVSTTNHKRFDAYETKITGS